VGALKGDLYTKKIWGLIIKGGGPLFFRANVNYILGKFFGESFIKRR